MPNYFESRFYDFLNGGIDDMKRDLRKYNIQYREHWDGLINAYFQLESFFGDRPPEDRRLFDNFCHSIFYMRYEDEKHSYKQGLRDAVQILSELDLLK